MQLAIAECFYLRARRLDLVGCKAFQETAHDAWARIEMTFEDPKYYTRPFTIKTAVNLLPDTDALEFVCAENEKDRAHLGK